jgi:hypothetical protein
MRLYDKVVSPLGRSEGEFKMEGIEKRKITKKAYRLPSS